MRYDVRHRTTYRYSQPVSISHHVLRLVPRRHDLQVLRASSLSIEPNPALRSDAEDYFGNPLTFLTVQEQHEQLTIESRSLIDVEAPEPRDPS
jgi:transglutaminase-like putative cysteine protease